MKEPASHSFTDWLIWMFAYQFWAGEHILVPNSDGTLTNAVLGTFKIIEDEVGSEETFFLPTYTVHCIKLTPHTHALLPVLKRQYRTWWLENYPEEQPPHVQLAPDGKAAAQ